MIGLFCLIFQTLLQVYSHITVQNTPDNSVKKTTTPSSSKTAKTSCVKASASSSITVFIRQDNVSLVRRENSLFPLIAFNPANNQGLSLQKHIVMHSHTARKPTPPWPQRQRALDNIMAAITSLKWPCFSSSVSFTGPFCCFC